MSHSLFLHMALTSRLGGLGRRDPYYWMLVGAVTQFKSLPEPTQDCTGKKIIITGGNGGLGREAARTFVKLGAATVVIACRDLDSAEEAKTAIETTTGRTGVIKVWQLDLKSFDSVKELCHRAQRELDRLDCLVENAAVLSFSREMAEGHESSVTVNVISPMLMIFMLLPLMRKTAVQFNVVPHVTTMSSDAHLGVSHAEKPARARERKRHDETDWPLLIDKKKQAKFPERSQPNIFEALKSESSYQLDKYSTTKLVNLFVNRELAEQLGPDSSVVVNMVSPGLCRTRLFREMMFPFNHVFRVVELAVARTAEVGSRTLVHAASAGRDSHGRYLEACGIRAEEQFLAGEEGRKTQKKLYSELLAILEDVQPGATKI